MCAYVDSRMHVYKVAQGVLSTFLQGCVYMECQFQTQKFKQNSLKILKNE